MEVKAYSLAIIGDSGVGKTALAYRIVENNFKTKETKGGEYFQKIFYFHNQNIKIDIYGASGKEKYKKISKYLYKDAKGIIIMYKVDDEDSYNNIYNYLENIKLNSIENPIIYIVGNNFDDKNQSFRKNVEVTKIFNDEVFKHFVISCKTGKNIEKIISELTKEIVVNEKYYSSRMDKDLINPFNQSDKDEDFKSFIKNNNTKKQFLLNFLRCRVCHKPFVVTFKAMFNEVSVYCIFCELKENIKITEIDKYKINGITCFCTKNDKNPFEKNNVKYCNICKHFFCKHCKKVHNKSSECNLYPYNLMDICCYKDKKINLGFCKTCNQYFCIKCANSHKEHELFYFKENITEFIKENDENIKKENNIINNFEIYYDDCLKELRKYFENFVNLKKKELKLKEELLIHLKNIQNNYQLYETVKNFRFMKKIKYDFKSSWDQKLTDIFEVIGMPIQIKNINISRNKNYEVNPTLINSGYFDNPLQSECKDITDICSLDNDKLTGISFNNGTFEIYENLKIKKSTFTLLENGLSINSIYKSKRNINNFFICGPGQIKQVEFYDN